MSVRDGQSTKDRRWWRGSWHHDSWRLWSLPRYYWPSLLATAGLALTPCRSSLGRCCFCWAVGFRSRSHSWADRSCCPCCCSRLWWGCALDAAVPWPLAGTNPPILRSLSSRPSARSCSASLRSCSRRRRGVTLRRKRRRRPLRPAPRRHRQAPDRADSPGRWQSGPWASKWLRRQWPACWATLANRWAWADSCTSADWRDPVEAIRLRPPPADLDKLGTAEPRRRRCSRPSSCRRWSLILGSHPWCDGWQVKCPATWASGQWHRRRSTTDSRASRSGVSSEAPTGRWARDPSSSIVCCTTSPARGATVASGSL